MIELNDRTKHDFLSREQVQKLLDGYWMCCTEDLTNPYPHEVREDDWEVYANHAEVVNMRTIK